MPRFHRLEQRARAAAGHKNDHLEFAFAGQQAIGEIQRRVIILERHLAHRRRDYRDAAAPLDHRRDLGRHPALERDDAKSAEAGRDVRGIGFRVWVHRERPRRIDNLAARTIATSTPPPPAFAVCGARTTGGRNRIARFAIGVLAVGCGEKAKKSNVTRRIEMAMSMRVGTCRLVLSTIVAFIGVAWISSPARAQIALSPAAANVAESAPIPASRIPKEITDAINSPDRPAADKALDAGRRPDQIMAFYGIKPGMKIADIFAGGGYMTELFARIAGSTGTVYSQNGPFPEQFKKIKNTWNERLKEPALKNVVKVSKPFDAPDLLPVPPDSLDAVIIHLNYHDLVGFKLNRENVNAAVFKALKPAGIYGIV